MHIFEFATFAIKTQTKCTESTQNGQELGRKSLGLYESNGSQTDRIVPVNMEEKGISRRIKHVDNTTKVRKGKHYFW